MCRHIVLKPPFHTSHLQLVRKLPSRDITYMGGTESLNDPPVSQQGPFKTKRVVGKAAKRKLWPLSSL